MDISRILNQVTIGNCVPLMEETVPDDSIDLSVTSPPYGELRLYKGYSFEFEKIARGLYRVTKPGGVVVWVVGDETNDGDESGESFRQALYFKEIGFKLYDTMIYEKSGFRFPRPNAYHNVFEYMFVLSKGMPKTVHLIRDRRNFNNESNALARQHMKREKDGNFTGRKPYKPEAFGPRYNVWRYTVGSSVSKDKAAFDHPAIFPEELARDHILSWSNSGDIVFDPMCGSGTTLKKAKELGRNFIGFEISIEYGEIARRRVRFANEPLFLLEVEQLKLPEGEVDEPIES